MKPNPPRSMRVKITPFPKSFQCSVVETTVRPVTVTAEVEVKKASSKEVKLSSALDMGRAKRRPPTVMRMTKP